MEPFTVLTVCLGNICRSPMMEQMLAKAATDRLGQNADSMLFAHGAGTGGWHVGHPMDPAAARQLRRRGIDPAGFRARKLRAEHLEASDLILTATAEQSEYARELVPDAADRIFVLGELDRLLAQIDEASLPEFAPTPAAVLARGVTLVEALAKLRGGEQPLARDEVEDPWGGGDATFRRVADGIEEIVQRLARTLLT